MIDYSKITHINVDGKLIPMPSLEDWPMCAVSKCPNRCSMRNKSIYCSTHIPVDWDPNLFIPVGLQDEFDEDSDW